MPSVLTTDQVRSHFPALQRTEDDRPVAYFDGPGGTQVPTVVADAVREYLLEHNGNGGWNYPTSRETDAIMHAGRSAMADLFGGAPDEIAFGPSMTALTLRLSRALGRDLSPGDRVVVTELDHHANVDPWKALGDERGAEIRVVRMDPADGTLDMDDLASAVAGASILAIGAASNALGTRTDVRAAARWARDAGATVFVDAVHFAPHELLDVAALGADFVAASPYKFYGPHMGVLWGRRERIDALKLPRVASAPDTSPERLETGTPAYEAIAGGTAAVDFIASIAGDLYAGNGRGAKAASGGPDRRSGGTRRERLEVAYRVLGERGDALFARLWEGMNAIDGVRTFGPPPGQPRTPTLGFAINGMDAREAAGAYAGSGLFITSGDFYATTVIRRLGYEGRGILRAGCVAYTTEEEVDRLVEATIDIDNR
jgi:cysteine desulfurase family protein (TIGR01976 family)